MSQLPPESPASVESPERESNGRFTRGNSGGPGNPFGRQIAELRQALLDTVTPEELCNLIGAMVRRAIDGDVAAAKLVLQYTLGKPAEAVDPDRVDIDEYRIRQDAAIPDIGWMNMLGSTTEVDVVNHMAEAYMPVSSQIKKQTFADAIKPHPDTPAGRRAERKAKKRFHRAMNGRPSPSPNGSADDGPKLRFDKHGFPLDRGFGPDRAG